MPQEGSRIGRVASLDFALILLARTAFCCQAHAVTLKRGVTDGDLEADLARQSLDVLECQLDRSRVAVVLKVPQRRTWRALLASEDARSSVRRYGDETDRS